LLAPCNMPTPPAPLRSEAPFFFPARCAASWPTSPQSLKREIGPSWTRFCAHQPGRPTRTSQAGLFTIPPFAVFTKVFIVLLSPFFTFHSDPASLIINSPPPTCFLLPGSGPPYSPRPVPIRYDFSELFPRFFSSSCAPLGFSIPKPSGIQKILPFTLDRSQSSRSGSQPWILFPWSKVRILPTNEDLLIRAAPPQDPVKLS